MDEITLERLDDDESNIVIGAWYVLLGEGEWSLAQATRMQGRLMWVFDDGPSCLNADCDCIAYKLPHGKTLWNSL